MKWHTFQPEQSEGHSPGGTVNNAQGSPDYDGAGKAATAAEEKLMVEEEKPTRPLLTAIQGENLPVSKEEAEKEGADVLHSADDDDQTLELRARQVLTLQFLLYSPFAGPSRLK